jgi:hypothetical protein
MRTDSSRTLVLALQASRSFSECAQMTSLCAKKVWSPHTMLMSVVASSLLAEHHVRDMVVVISLDDDDVVFVVVR